MFNAMSSRIAILFLLIASQMATAQQTDTEAGDQMIADYFAAETKKLTNRVLGNVTSVDDWKRRQPELRRQLLDMLGLHPLPKRGELDIVVTGEIKEDTFTVKKLHFQSVPGFYVTANLYEPEKIDDRLPAILYVCGHGKVEENGVSYGNKVHYHHHGSWFARNGYVCLTIDTLQLGEIEGIHHGTYREKMWWWLNRGYTPAGVEAWNCMRAIDFLQTLDNVDPDRIGVTGRSGGGAYSWWIAAIDERIKCAVPVAGITDLQNHVVDGVVEGHCDCMFMVNTYRWDYPVVAALVAPRPLLISNTDRDSIFPLDGVYRTFTKVRDIYDLHGASDKVALHITAGTHKDTQELRMHAFRWLNHHLKGDDALIVTAAEKYFEPEQLRVFAELPRDQINTTIQETFVPVARPKMPNDATEWKRMTNEWRAKLLAHTFAGWPRAESTPKPKRVFRYSNNKTNLQAFDFSPQSHIQLRMFALTRSDAKEISNVELRPLDQADWNQFATNVNASFGEHLAVPLPRTESKIDLEPLPISEDNVAIVWIAPRGIGHTAWNQSDKKQTQIRRRFYLLGQTLDAMRVYDVRRAMQAVREIPEFAASRLTVRARGRMAGIALYASLFETNIASMGLSELQSSHRHGPYLLNVRRIFDLPQALAMAAEQTPTILHTNDRNDWEYTMDALNIVGGKIELRP